MAKIDENFLHFLHIQVWSGYYDAEEIFDRAFEALEEEWYDATTDDIDDKALKTLIDKEFEQKRKDEQSWPAKTDCDRLTQAFDELTNLGILALENAGYTMDEGWSDFREAAELEDDVRGGCFFHGQDLERAVSGEGLLLAFGATDGGNDATIAREVVEVLKRHGFSPTWDGDPQKRIELPINWQKKSVSVKA